MKIDARSSVVQMEPEVLHNLVREIKETLATDVPVPKRQKPVFTAADLWHIQRNARTARLRFKG